MTTTTTPNMACSSDTPTWSLTSHLLSIDKRAYEAATRALFLEAAGQGRVSKKTLGEWLANDRLYTHAYIKAAGRALASIELPQTTAPTSDDGRRNPPATPELVDWLCDTLVALRREDHLFQDVAKRYGIPIDLEVDATTAAAADPGREAGPRVRDAAKIPGLVMFERLFGSLSVPTQSANHHLLLPWLEAAVVFWGTEKVYSDAWAWAKTFLQEGAKEDADADSGALRKDFIPNWSSDEFVAFVDKLGDIVNDAVSGLVETHGESVKVGLIERAERVWRELVAAEGAFWPNV